MDEVVEAIFRTFVAWFVDDWRGNTDTNRSKKAAAVVGGALGGIIAIPIVTSFLTLSVRLIRNHNNGPWDGVATEMVLIATVFLILPALLVGYFSGLRGFASVNRQVGIVHYILTGAGYGLFVTSVAYTLFLVILLIVLGR